MNAMVKAGGIAALVGALAACETYQPQIVLYPVVRLASLNDAAAAHAAAAKMDRPVLILGAGVYALHEACIPKRYFGDSEEGRLSGADQDGRLGGSDADARLGGSDADARLGGSDADARLGGSDADARLGGSDADARLGGSDADARLGGSDADARLGGSGADMRAFGATETTLKCRLAADLATVEIFGGGGATGALYSARRGGDLGGVLFY